MRSQLPVILYIAVVKNSTPAAESSGVPAVIITIPSLICLALLVTLTTTTIVLVCKRWNNQGTRAEAYYTTVGPPLPPAKLEKNQSYEGNLESLRIANTEDDQTTVIVTTNEDVAYHHTNTAAASEIQTGEDVAYSSELHDIIENIAYGTNIAIAPEIQVEENVAYSCNLDDTCGPQDSSCIPNEDVTDMVPSSVHGTNVSISAPEIET